MSGERFEGRKAIVTGGASGIGLGVCARLSAEGAEVALWDSDADALKAAQSTKGPFAAAIPVDITDPAAVDRALLDTVSVLGGVDILITSAGITGPNTIAWDYPIAAWKRVIDVNLNGLFYCNRAVIPEMLKGGYGRIVNVASIAGKEGNPNASAYSASKAAVIGLTKSLGKELAKSGITVNCITPAAVHTPIFDQMTQEHIDFMLSKIPMGRFGKIEEVTSLICWLASEECSFTTGGVFDISGGRATY
ncbi:SDR family NAD(P)-dependent oxidoreductase [Microvirga puerhi]|uniref:SDR family oxidoreductase n=1 Tax=Microvirga puerhi TaxID=2876078 RepID=A0ABS7VRA1_9HYPH|nr:SDR family NAD(P)-dependent oxidoreductase [Microvirga puerhi]MBZ6077595.1 SDR family oxidoreductase [Microvirga puerhi]